MTIRLADALFLLPRFNKIRTELWSIHAQILDKSIIDCTKKIQNVSVMHLNNKNVHKR